LELGFKHCIAKHGMYMCGVGERLLITGIYVDDLIITNGDLGVLNKFKLEM
jgi:hypothetical protein